MKNRPDVDFVIFDLGNVLIDIDYTHAMDLMKKHARLICVWID